MCVCVCVCLSVCVCDTYSRILTVANIELPYNLIQIFTDIHSIAHTNQRLVGDAHASSVHAECVRGGVSQVYVKECWL